MAGDRAEAEPHKRIDHHQHRRRPVLHGNLSGALNIAVGVVALVVGVASGVLLLISGAKLLAPPRTAREPPPHCGNS